MKKIMNKFLFEIYNCTDAAVFLGIARILKVPLDETMTFEKMLPLVIKNFQKAPKKRKYEIVKIFKSANKEGKEKENGTTTTNTEEKNSD